jgi:hypothetical protein
MSYICLQQRPTVILQPPRSTSREWRRRKKEIPANALLAQLVEHFHGKEGVWGSSPQEGFSVLAGIFCIVSSFRVLVGGHLGATSSSRRANLALCRQALAAPVGDDAGVVRFDHPHAVPTSRPIWVSGMPS